MYVSYTLRAQYVFNKRFYKVILRRVYNSEGSIDKTIPVGFRKFDSK